MIDAINHGWRLVFKENHLGRGMSVLGVRNGRIGVREGIRLAWVFVSTWLNTGTLWQYVQPRPKDHRPQPEQPWGGGGPGALAGRLPACCLLAACLLV